MISHLQTLLLGAVCLSSAANAVDCSDYDIEEGALSGDAQVYGMDIPLDTFDFLGEETVNVVVYLPTGQSGSVYLTCDTVNEEIDSLTSTLGIESSLVSSRPVSSCDESPLEIANFTLPLQKFTTILDPKFVPEFESGRLSIDGFTTTYVPTCYLTDVASEIIIARIAKVFTVTMDDDLSYSVSSEVLAETVDNVQVTQDIDELVAATMTPPIFQDGQVIVLDYDLEALNPDAEGVFQIVSIDSLTVTLSVAGAYDALMDDQVALSSQTKTETGYVAAFALPSSAYLLNTPQSVVISAEITIGLTSGEATFPVLRRSVRRSVNMDLSVHDGEVLEVTTNGMAAAKIEEEQTVPSNAMAVAPAFAGVFTALLASAFVL